MQLHQIELSTSATDLRTVAIIQKKLTLTLLFNARENAMGAISTGEPHDLEAKLLSTRAA